MKKTIKIVTALVILSSIALFSYYLIQKKLERQKVHKYSEIAKEEIVDKFYDGGQDIYIEIRDYEVDPYNGNFKIDVKLNWNGAHASFNRYWVTDLLDVDSETGNLTWVPKVYSKNLKLYLQVMGIWEKIIKVNEFYLGIYYYNGTN